MNLPKGNTFTESIIKYSTWYNKNMSMYRGHSSKVQDAFEMKMQRRQMTSIKYVHVHIA